MTAQPTKPAISELEKADHQIILQDTLQYVLVNVVVTIGVLFFSSLDTIVVAAFFVFAMLLGFLVAGCAKVIVSRLHALPQPPSGWLATRE